MLKDFLVLKKMKNLEKKYIIERKDINTTDKKIVKKYSDIIKKHKKLDLRLNIKNSDLIHININSIEKIFHFLENEVEEEYILFLLEKEYIDKKLEQNNDNIITTNKKEEEIFENEEKKDFLTLEVENPVLKKFKTLTHQIMKKYYFIFCILCFIIAILFIIHLFSYLISDEAKSQYNSINFLKIEFFKYIGACSLLIFLYLLLGYYYYTKYKTDKPPYLTIRKLQIFCFAMTIINYILLISTYFSPEELVKHYKKHWLYISLIYILSFLCSFGILGFYFMVKKRRGNFSQYDEVLIQ